MPRFSFTIYTSFMLGLTTLSATLCDQITMILQLQYIFKHYCQIAINMIKNEKQS